MAAGRLNNDEVDLCYFAVILELVGTIDMNGKHGIL